MLLVREIILFETRVNQPLLVRNFECTYHSRISRKSELGHKTKRRGSIALKIKVKADEWILRSNW